MIADGGDHILTWDGSVLSELVTSPAGVTALAEITGRVCCNSTDDLDAVYMSSVEDETVWSGGTSLGIRCGFGDLMVVNALAVAPGGKDLFVSKTSQAKKVIYRISVTDPDPDTWTALPISPNNAAQNAHTMITAGNNTFLVDYNGFKSIKGVQEYGDFQDDPFTGAKVSVWFNLGPTIYEAVFVPAFSAIWFNTATRVYCYHIKNSAFTEMVFKQGKINSICQVGPTTIYLAGETGYLYKIDILSQRATDETAPGTLENFISRARTKYFSLTDQLLLKKLEVNLSPKAVGSATINACTTEKDTVILKTISLLGLGDYVYDATDYVYDAADYLVDSGIAPWIQTTRERVRSSTIGFEIATSSGRVSINKMNAELATVKGN